MNDNEKYIGTLEEILDRYAVDCESAIDIVIVSCTSVIKTFRQLSMARDIIEIEISKMHEMVNYLTRNYEVKSNRLGAVAIDLGIILNEKHFIDMNEYAIMTLANVQEEEFKDTNIDIHIDEF